MRNPVRLFAPSPFAASVAGLVAALLLALLGLTGPLAGGASAAPGDASPNQPPKLTFGIGPALPVPATQVVDGRPYLRYLSSPGGTVRDAVAVLNLGNEPIRLHLYPTDAVQTTDGTFGLSNGDAKTADAGSWFKLRLPKSGMVTIPARKGRHYGRVEIPFEARIPAKAAPGDHVAGIVASLETESKKADGTKIKFDQRIGIRAYFRVSGPLNPALTVENLTTSYHWQADLHGRDSVTVDYDVHNTGNVRMNATQLVNLSRPFRSAILQTPPPLADILPGSTIHVSQTVPGNFEALGLKTLVSVFPVPLDPDVPGKGGFVQASAKTFAWQWPVIALVALLLLIAIITGWYRRHRRNLARRNEPGAPGSRRAGRRAKGEEGRRAKKAQPVARVAAGVLAAALPLAAIAAASVAGAPTAHADVSQPDGGRMFLEAGRPTGEPKRALTDGIWGHEGPRGDLGTYVGMDLTDSQGKVSDAAQAFWTKRFGVDSFDKLGIAFVKASADGSTERPAVTAGQNAGQVFKWFTDSSPTSGWTGTGHQYTDQVVVVHTLAEYKDWVTDGKPDQVFDNRLVAHDALRPGTPVAAHPSGRSIQNRWAAGQKLSLVVFAYTGFDPDGIPLVAADDTGHAETAWLTFTTKARPGDPVATSGAYHVLGASDLPKKPDEVSDDPSAEVNPGGTGTGDSPGGNQGASAGADATAGAGKGGTEGSSATGGASAQRPAARAGIGTLWSGSSWTWPIVGVLLVVGALVGGTALMRNRTE